MITPDMKLVKKADAQNAWSWYTPLDATEEIPRPEKFTIKFKTQEIADKFKEAFDACQKLMSVAQEKDEVTNAPLSGIGFMVDQQQTASAKGGLPLSHFPNQFSITQTPESIKPLMETSSTETKPNPFAGFSFVKPTSTTNTTATSTSTPFSGFSFSKTSPVPPQTPPVVATTHPQTPTPTVGANVNQGVPDPSSFPMISSLLQQQIQQQTIKSPSKSPQQQPSSEEDSPSKSVITGKYFGHC